MNPMAMRLRWKGHVLVVLMALAVAVGALWAPAAAQSGKKALTIDDYARWRSIESPMISRDGAWVAYVFSFPDVLDTKPVVHVRRLDSDKDHEIANGAHPAFSDDSKWLTYSVDLPYEEAKKLRDENKPVPRKAQLLDLTTGTRSTWEDVQSFEFAKGSGHLLLRRRQADPNAKNKGVDVVLRDLKSGRDQLLGDVGEAKFNKAGELLAYTVDAAQRDANGVYVIDLRSGVQTTLDSDARIYAQLTWNEEGTAIAFVKGLEVEKKAERENVLLAFADAYGVATRKVAGAPAWLDPATAEGFPKEMVLSERGTLSWSADRTLVFFGIKEQKPVPDPADKKKGLDELADVDVWRWNDERIQSVQRESAETDRNFTYHQAFHLPSGRFVRLTDPTMREIDFTRDGRWGIGRDTRAYISDWKELRADYYRVNPSTGERKEIVHGQIGGGGYTFGTSPDGCLFLYWRDRQFWVYNLEFGTTRKLTGSAPINFTDAEWDYRGTRPCYGIAGWTKDGKAIILQHRYDLWLQPLDGGAATNLTYGVGAKNQISFRYVNLKLDEGEAWMAWMPWYLHEERVIDLSKPVLLSAYGQWTKKSGFYELSNQKLRELVFEDAHFGIPLKAQAASRFLFTRETFVEFPDLRVSGPEMRDSEKITDANPQQAEYAWGHRILFDYKNNSGVRLQGILAIPDDYKPGERRPMIVDFYEKRSSELNCYEPPSYMHAFGRPIIEALSKGYLLMEPDIHFGTNRANADMLECVEAATKKVIEMGYADPKHIALHGHSFGGQGAAYISTRSKMFAAIGVGAGTSDLFDDFSHFWGVPYLVKNSAAGGENTNRYYMRSQGRIGQSPWDNPELYHEQSALTHVRSMNTPLLIMQGTEDPAVNVMEALQFYNALRFNGKNVLLLVYPGEGHGLSHLANRRDLTIRAMQFFDYYLRGTPAPRWIREGVSFLEKDLRNEPK